MMTQVGVRGDDGKDERKLHERKPHEQHEEGMKGHNKERGSGLEGRGVDQRARLQMCPCHCCPP